MNGGPGFCRRYRPYRPYWREASLLLGPGDLAEGKNFFQLLHSAGSQKIGQYLRAIVGTKGEDKMEKRGGDLHKNQPELIRICSRYGRKAR